MSTPSIVLGWFGSLSTFCRPASPLFGVHVKHFGLLVRFEFSALVEEENKLRSAGPGSAERLKHVEEQLDRCWDLLRQRRAKREFGEDPDTAQVRDIGTVENYEG